MLLEDKEQAREKTATQAEDNAVGELGNVLPLEALTAQATLLDSGAAHRQSSKTNKFLTRLGSRGRGLGSRAAWGSSPD